MIDAIGALFDPSQPVNLNRRLNERIEDVRSFVRDGAIPTVTAVAANNGPRWTEQAQQRIDSAARDFGRQVEWRHIGSAELLALLQGRTSIEADLTLSGAATVETFDFRRALTGRMSVTELARLTAEFGNRLFDRNIRRYLGLAGNRVNEAVATTLRDPHQRPNFYFYNNGITITCSQFRHNALQREGWRVRVSDLQIVNGGQTARTVQHVAQEIGPETISAAEVLVRTVRAREGRRRARRSDHFRHQQPEPGRPAGLEGERSTPEGPRGVDRRTGIQVPRQARRQAGFVRRIHERRDRRGRTGESGAGNRIRRGSEADSISARCTTRSSPRI